ncbi:hypothetical protein X756_09835 [Mesorhizobium sp. LSHC412B00]|nr:hypothetical protein X756_09835 [Mesorhizobium sp. LSHC412B00]
MVGSVAAMNSASADDQEKIVVAMRQIASAWQDAISSQRPLLMACGDNTFQVRRFLTDSTVSVDLRRTDSLMNPYLGIIFIQGGQESNGLSQRANGARMDTLNGNRVSCFKTKSDALSANELNDFSQEFLGSTIAYTVYYHLDGDVMKLNNGDDQFVRNFAYHLSNIKDNIQLWKDVLVSTFQ